MHLSFVSLIHSKLPPRDFQFPWDYLERTRGKVADLPHVNDPLTQTSWWIHPLASEKPWETCLNPCSLATFLYYHCLLSLSQASLPSSTILSSFKMPSKFHQNKTKQLLKWYNSSRHKICRILLIPNKQVTGSSIRPQPHLLFLWLTSRCHIDLQLSKVGHQNKLLSLYSWSYFQVTWPGKKLHSWYALFWTVWSYWIKIVIIKKLLQGKVSQTAI